MRAARRSAIAFYATGGRPSISHGAINLIPAPARCILPERAKRTEVRLFGRGENPWRPFRLCRMERQTAGVTAASVLVESTDPLTVPEPGRVVIINDMATARGGATKLALQLTHGLASRGIKVTFFTGDDGKNEDVKADGVDVAPVGGRPLLESRRGMIDGIYNHEASMRLKALIAAVDGPDVVYHVHSWSQILSPSIFDALKPVAARTSLTAHDFFLVCPNGTYSIYPKSEQCQLQPMSIKCVTTDCDKRHYAHKVWRLARQVVLKANIDFRSAPFSVLAIQSGMVPYLTRGGVPEKNITVLTNPANRLLEERTPAETNEEILYVGRLDHEKGPDLIADVAREAGARLRIIGAGEDEPAVRRAYPEAEFQGWTEPEEIAAAFRTARFFVMPSRCTEPFGLAAAEALRAGLPVMTSTLCLIGDDIKRKGMGDVCNMFDRDAFLKKVRHWLTDNDAIQSMSRAAYERAGEIAHTESQWIDSHLTHYERQLGEANLQ